jgi:hypothetical protein
LKNKKNQEMRAPIINNIKFEKHSLVMKLNYSYEGNYDSIQFCAVVSNQFNCKLITNLNIQTLEYNEAELSFGEEYSFFLNITGCDLTCSNRSNIYKAITG